LNPKSFHTAGRSAETRRKAYQYVIGLELSFVETLTLFHNAFSSSTKGAKSEFSDLDYLPISGAIPTTDVFPLKSLLSWKIKKNKVNNTNRSVISSLERLKPMNICCMSRETTHC